MSMCRVFLCVVGRGCLLWPVYSLARTLLAFALLHFVLQGQICLLLQVFLGFLLLHSSPLYWKGHLFGVLVLEPCPYLKKKQKLLNYLLLLLLSCPVCPTLCDPMDCSTPGVPVPHHLPSFSQVHVHCIGDAIHLSQPLMPSSPSALDLSQHQSFFQWVTCLHQRTKILKLQLQHQSFQWILGVDLP